ncbi:MAG: hypothetical protein ACREE0_10915 [Phenylobacterium sp.]
MNKAEPPEPVTTLVGLYMDALTEMVAAILRELEKGRKPQQGREPGLSYQDNGMPSLSDGYFGSGGPPQYSDLLDPPYGDEAARKRGKYPTDQYPALNALRAFAAENPEASPRFSSEIPRTLADINIQLEVESAANGHVLMFGETAATPRSANLALRKVLKSVVERRLRVAILAPIAMVGFTFDRLRLAPDAFIMRMSAPLQKARWDAKAYGAKGHDSVLSAATHAFVLTGFTIENADIFAVGRTMSGLATEPRERFELMFAALRLETGIETGYAQELRLARGWRTFGRLERPEVYGVGARRYPEAFDDFGWTRESVPKIDREQMGRVRAFYAAMRTSTDPRLHLALRRLNAAAIRADAADAILDATIALEILLGDEAKEAISWKLRMRAAALAGMGGDREAMDAMWAGVARVYDVRSGIVHGLTSRKRQKSPAEIESARQEALDILRMVLKALLAQPTFLKPGVIDRELLLSPSPPNSRDR